MLTALTRKVWDSKSALLDFLETTEGASLLVGEGTEADREYQSFSVRSDRGTVEVGVISACAGSVVAAVVMGGGRRLVVGHDTWVTVVELRGPCVERCIPLGGVFYEFFQVEDASEVVVLHELGAVLIDERAEVRWSVETGVIESWLCLEESKLVLEIMDEERVIISLGSGEQVEA